MAEVIRLTTTFWGPERIHIRTTNDEGLSVRSEITEDATSFTVWGENDGYMAQLNVKGRCLSLEQVQAILEILIGKPTAIEAKEEILP